MVLRVWVRLPTGSPTRLTLYPSDESSSESIIVDDLRDGILSKYPNALGRYYDTADIQLRLISRPMSGSSGGSSVDEVVLVLDDSVAQILNQFYPGGQRAAEAFIIYVPELLSAASNSQQHLHHTHGYSSNAMTIVEPLEDFPVNHQSAAVQVNSSLPPTLSPGSSSLPPAAVHRPRLLHRETGLSTPGVLLLPANRRRSSNEAVPLAPSAQHAHQQPGPSIGRNSSSSSNVASKDGGGAYIGRPPLTHRRTPSLNDPLPTIPQNSSSESPPVLSATAPNGTPISVKSPEISPERIQNPSQAETMVQSQSLSLPQPQPPTPYAHTAKSTATSAATMLASATSAPAVLEAVVLQINVLIVEDNIVNQRILEAFMHKRKIFCATAKDGREAVEKWKKGHFHLVLMDIQLPVMSGIEATREIRRLERLNRIGVFPPSTPPAIEIGEPDMNNSSLTSNSKDSKLLAVEDRAPVIIVALTASSLQSDRREALAAGCNDFLTKPVSFVWLERKTVEWGCMQALIRFKSRLPSSPTHSKLPLIK